MTLLKDLIEIPEHIDKGQFVLRLTEGVTDPRATVESYVPTPQLVRCFDDALHFIRGAISGNTSKATYLHGSFGSGKSHFMAILHLMLQGDLHAKGIADLAAIIQKHNEWSAGKRFLLVPYHMIGARDVESGILGGYVDYVRRNHPEAPIPGVYLAEGLFRDAQALRTRMGDAAFFAALSEGSAAGGDFGDVEAGWDAVRFEAAIEDDPGSEERSQLISALVGKFFGSYDTQAGGRGEAFLSLDKGLSVISKHAQSLGYDAVILFLDELILWLASHATDLRFVHQEGQKLAKLVEAQTADRPVPIISFIARQRDLSELIGDSVPGADKLNFSDALKHWEGRFHKITLEDRNLPAIAEKRILRCKSEAARNELDAAFAQTAKIREAVMATLLTSAGDREMFRKVYPFSPALVQTLIAVSSVLQRERTALKVMAKLLSDNRDTIEVGDLIPVGDLFDVIAHGDEAFSQEMAIHFGNAERLYQRKLLPMLEKQHGRREELERLTVDDTRRVAFHNDDRLVKTLLLSALVPEVESLRALNAERLAALNHGTIKTPIPGREGQEVLRRCRNWAASVGEIRLGEESNPTISLQLSDVDTESIIRQAEREDNQGNRIRRVRQMLFEQLGIDGEGEFEQHYNFLWKNTSCSCDILFRNIRELQDSSLENHGDQWRLIIDFPFDEPGHGAKDDLSRIQSFRAAHPRGAKTICWVPQFFSDDARRDLGLLVILEHVLTGERFNQYANHLSAQDRQAARTVLDSQRSVLRQRVENHLDAAYGLEAFTPGSIDTTHALEPHEQFVSLWSGFDPQPPVAAKLASAMTNLLFQALEYEFPAAPSFEAEIKTANLKKVHLVVAEAARSADGRVFVDKPLRPLVRHIANPLLLGEMGHDVDHFVLGQHWKDHFSRKAAAAGGQIIVGQLRDWIDEPRRMGLPVEAQNLVILTFADQTNRTFLRHNLPVDGSLTSLSDDWVVAEQRLPAESDWQTAVALAGSIFGEATSPLLKAGNVAALSSAVKKRAADALGDCREYCQQLRKRLVDSGQDPADADRMKTATSTLALVDRLQQTEAEQIIPTLAHAQIATTAAAMGECVKKSGQLLGALKSTNWEIFEAIGKLADERRLVAQEIRESVQRVLKCDEHVISLAAALQAAQSKAVRLLTESSPVHSLPTKAASPQPTTTAAVRVVRRDSRENVDLAQARELLSDLERDLATGQRLRLSLSWIIEEGGD
jgi:hypothetical protein